MIRLVIKGTAEEARKALDDRGLLTTEALGVAPEYDEVWTKVHPSDLRIVQTWFCEPPGQEPYPAGTLLYYRED